MSPTLLADLAVMMSSSPEDVATRALDLLLQRSPSARGSVDRLLNEWRGRTGPPVARWVSQVAGRDDARTDLQGYDEKEQVLAILENKFLAGLTANQPTTYLGRLSDPDGILVFVAPSTRLELLTHELGLRLREAEERAADFGRVGDSHVTHLLSGRTLAVTSWSALLRSIGAVMEAAEEYDNLADMRQLQGLAGKMEKEGFRPFTVGDLTGDSPRLVLRMCDLVDGAVQQLLTRPFANKKNLKASAGQGWYGHYVRIHGFGCQLIMTAWRWSANGVSPVWLRVSTSDWRGLPEALRLPLRSAVDDPSSLIEDHARGWSGYWIPIRLVEGREREAVLSDMLRQLERIAAVLGTHPEAGTEAPPPDDVTA